MDVNAYECSFRRLKGFEGLLRGVNTLAQKIDIDFYKLAPVHAIWGNLFQGQYIAFLFEAIEVSAFLSL